MSLILKGAEPYKGFLLQEPLVVECSLAMFTGKNGSGKTRFLESISTCGHVAVDLGGELLLGGQIKYLDYKSLVPCFSGGYKEVSRVERVDAVYGYLKSSGENLIDPATYFPDNQEIAGVGVLLNASEVYALCVHAAEKLNKKTSELSRAEIDVFYDEYKTSVLGGVSLEGIFAQYAIKKRAQLIGGLLEQAGHEGQFYIDSEKFEGFFGAPPWIVVNEIMLDVFDGKFRFSEPGLVNDKQEYGGALVDADGNSVSVELLSSGEQTLLWVAGLIFRMNLKLVANDRAPKLLLMDEPDAFLHPSMIVKLLDLFDRFSKTFGINIFITTHSPTTVALAKEGAIYNINGGAVRKIERDVAIADLLEGVAQISVSPHNRRQVYVESHHDGEIYQNIYQKIAHRNDILNPQISLFFISSGLKLPRKLLQEKLKQVFGDKLNPDDVELFVQMVNGGGCSSKVIGTVESLIPLGAGTVRGLIDRDEKGNPNLETNHIIVLGGLDFYTIENVVFDPVCVSLALHMADDKKYSMERLCGEEVGWGEWLERPELIQVTVSTFLSEVLSIENMQDFKLCYMGGISVGTDRRYLDYHGHDLAEKVIEVYPELKRLGGDADKIKKELVRRIMLLQTGGKFIPTIFGEAFSKLQRA